MPDGSGTTHGPEEYPNFVSFWLERPAKNSSKRVVCALLDSPSVASAYRFEIQPTATLVMGIKVALYPRKTIERLGIAPLISMFQCGENDCRLPTIGMEFQKQLCTNALSAAKHVAI